MLKKTAVAAAIIVAGLMAVSPLAFATGSHPSHVTNTATDESAGLVNVADNNVNTPIQACNNDVPVNGGAAAAQVPVKDITGAATGALGLFGSAAARTDQAVDNSRECGDNTASGDSVAQEADPLAGVKGAGPPGPASFALVGDVTQRGTAKGYGAHRVMCDYRASTARAGSGISPQLGTPRKEEYPHPK